MFILQHVRFDKVSEFHRIRLSTNKSTASAFLCHVPPLHSGLWTKMKSVVNVMRGRYIDIVNEARARACAGADALHPCVQPGR